MFTISWKIMSNKNVVTILCVHSYKLVVCLGSVCTMDVFASHQANAFATVEHICIPQLEGAVSEV